MIGGAGKGRTSSGAGEWAEAVAYDGGGPGLAQPLLFWKSIIGARGGGSPARTPREQANGRRLWHTVAAGRERLSHWPKEGALSPGWRSPVR